MIYFIRAADTTFYKVGYTAREPDDRLKELQTGSAHPLKVEYIFEGSLDDEALIHEHLDRYKVHGEWFDLSVPALFEVFVNKLFEPDTRINMKPVDSVTQSNHIKVFFEEHVVFSKKKPVKPVDGTEFGAFYDKYIEFCHRSRVYPQGEKYFKQELASLNLKVLKIPKTRYIIYPVRIKEDSFLNHSSIKSY